MTHISQHFGKATTAIAAVLAFSATQAFTQETGAPPEPVTDTSVQTPASDPLAPDSTTSESPVVIDTAAPPAPKPKVETTKTSAQRNVPSPSNSAARSTAKGATARRASSAPAAPAAAPPIEAVAPAPLPAEAQPPAVAEPAPQPIATPAPANDTAGTSMSDLLADDMLPVAGAAALGLIALGGAGIAMRRRRRRREDEEFEARQQALAMAEAEPVLELDQAAEVRPAPTFARTPAPVHDAVPDKKVSAAKLPNGFDLSPYGRHVRAAYRGPTSDNPSVSLDYRLRRAASMDEQEGKLAEVDRD